MVQRRGRPLRGFGDGGSSSSDDDDDAFASALSGKKKRRLGAGPAPPAGRDEGTRSSAAPPPPSGPLPAADTSSNKRHHHTTDRRAARMDDILSDLKSFRPPPGGGGRGGRDRAGDYRHSDQFIGSAFDGEDYGGSHYGSGSRAPLAGKMGSFVERGLEHMTTNLFVGNLDPSTTEEELTEVFREYGDLYSVKIMWPRTHEERARQRNTGFVCFMTREGAEDAMESLAEQDPLGTGRRLLINWGKNVKKTVKKGVGVPLNFRKKTRDDDKADKPPGDEAVGDGDPSGPPRAHAPPSARTASCVGPAYDPLLHQDDAIFVEAPSDPRRAKFITTVAEFVSKDGSVLEQKLFDTRGHEEQFAFLRPRPGGGGGTASREHVYYRWRVYAFCQGDTRGKWRSEPFVMFHPGGRFWIPPPPDAAGAEEEESAERRREQERTAAREERRKTAERRDDGDGGTGGGGDDVILTGAQIKRAEHGGGCRLNDWERRNFDDLLRNRLTSSRESICDAMIFAFEKSNAAVHVAGLLEEALLEGHSDGTSVETRIARLYLLSDILYNSQQPGVRNAFQYRTAIERMAPAVFGSLGEHAGGGRITKSKLRKSVNSVLSAWTNWSVFDSGFIDELECKFEGKEIKKAEVKKVDEAKSKEGSEQQREKTGTDAEPEIAIVSTIPRGTWSTAKDDEPETAEAGDMDGEPIDGDLDGESLGDEDVGADIDQDDIDGESLSSGDLIVDEDCDDIDGEELDEADLEDGEALDDDEAGLKIT